MGHGERETVQGDVVIGDAGIVTSPPKLYQVLMGNLRKHSF